LLSSLSILFVIFELTTRLLRATITASFQATLPAMSSSNPAADAIAEAVANRTTKPVTSPHRYVTFLLIVVMMNVYDGTNHITLAGTRMGTKPPVSQDPQLWLSIISRLLPNRLLKISLFLPNLKSTTKKNKVILFNVVSTLSMKNLSTRLIISTIVIKMTSPKAMKILLKFLV
jgi:hypothetical protein